MRVAIVLLWAIVLVGAQDSDERRLLSTPALLTPKSFEPLTSVLAKEPTLPIEGEREKRSLDVAGFDWKPLPSRATINVIPVSIKAPSIDAAEERRQRQRQDNGGAFAGTGFDSTSDTSRNDAQRDLLRRARSDRPASAGHAGTVSASTPVGMITGNLQPVVTGSALGVRLTENLSHDQRLAAASNFGANAIMLSSREKRIGVDAEYRSEATDGTTMRSGYFAGGATRATAAADIGCGRLGAQKGKGWKKGSAQFGMLEDGGKGNCVRFQGEVFAGAEAKGYIEGRSGVIGVNAEAAVQAGGALKGQFVVGKRDGRYEAVLEGDAFAGVRARGKVGGTAAGVGGSAAGSVGLGLGATGQFGVSYDKGKFKMVVGAGLYAGIGAQGSVGLEIDFPQMTKSARTALHKAAASSNQAVKTVAQTVLEGGRAAKVQWNKSEGLYNKVTNSAAAAASVVVKKSGAVYDAVKHEVGKAYKTVTSLQSWQNGISALGKAETYKKMGDALTNNAFADGLRGIGKSTMSLGSEIWGRITGSSSKTAPPNKNMVAVSRRDNVNDFTSKSIVDRSVNKVAKAVDPKGVVLAQQAKSSGFYAQRRHVDLPAPVTPAKPTEQKKVTVRSVGEDLLRLQVGKLGDGVMKTSKGSKTGGGAKASAPSGGKK